MGRAKNFVEGPVIQDKHGMWVRQGTSDEYVYGQIKAEYAPMRIDAGCTVLDLGANIGAASVLCIRRGASRVVAVEPDPTNFGMLERNTTGLAVERLRAAVAGHDGDAVLYLNDGKGKDAHSLVMGTIRRTNRISVPCVRLGSLLTEHRPDVVKCDIEGGEYDLPELLDLPDFVQVLCVELHLNAPGMREKGQAFARRYEKDPRWRAVRASRFTAKNWHTVPVYERA